MKALAAEIGNSFRVRRFGSIQVGHLTHLNGLFYSIPEVTFSKSGAFEDLPFDHSSTLFQFHESLFFGPFCEVCDVHFDCFDEIVVVAAIREVHFHPSRYFGDRLETGREDIERSMNLYESHKNIYCKIFRLINSLRNLYNES